MPILKQAIKGMKADWTRKLTINERLYSIGESLNPPFAMQFIIDGEGLIDQNEFTKAVDKLSTIYPVLLLKRDRKKWSLKGEKPRIYVHENSRPVDLSAGFYKTNLNAEAGQCVEFHLFQTDATSLVIRILHAAMDGIGAMKLIYALFSILKNEFVETLKSHPTENELRAEIGVKPTKNGGGFASKWNGLTPKYEFDSSDFSTELITFSDKITDGIAEIAHWYTTETVAPAQFLIPVNCRRHGVFTESLSNLSLPIYLKTNLGQTPAEIQAELLTKMAANVELGKDPLEKWVRLIPAHVLKKVLRNKIAKSHKSNRYAMSGYISDLGFIDLEALSYGEFKVKDFYSIPVYTATIPICFLIVHHQLGTRICFSAAAKYDRKALKSIIQTALTAVPNAKQEVAEQIDLEINPLEQELSLIWSKYLPQRVTQNDIQSTFSTLGGESLSLLFIVEEVGLTHCSSKQGQFLAEVLKSSSQITIREMALILENLSETL